MRVLITGLSGTGKSELVKELGRRQYAAFDADDDGYTTPKPDGTWAWRSDLIKSLFDGFGDGLVFFAGCSDEQASFEFDFKVLLTAPVEVIVERLQTRTTNTFGKSRAERDRVLADMQWVLPLLLASADLVIDTTTTTIPELANAVIEAVGSVRGRQSPL